MTGPIARWRRIAPARRRVGVYVTLVGLFAVLLIRLQATIDELHDLVDAEEVEEQGEDDEACVNAHERYAEVRRVIRNATVAGADLGAGAVAEVAGAEPEQLAAGQAYIEAHADDVLDPIVATYEPPVCDLVAALERLDRPAPASVLPLDSTTSPPTPPATPVPAPP